MRILPALFLRSASFLSSQHILILLRNLPSIHIEGRILPCFLLDLPCVENFAFLITEQFWLIIKNFLPFYFLVIVHFMPKFGEVILAVFRQLSLQKFDVFLGLVPRKEDSRFLLCTSIRFLDHQHSDPTLINEFLYVSLDATVAEFQFLIVFNTEFSTF